MKHKIINKRKLDIHHWLISVELIPETDGEITAIKKVEITEANDTQRGFINDYLLFSIGDSYSMITANSQGNNLFIVKAFLN